MCDNALKTILNLQDKTARGDQAATAQLYQVLWSMVFRQVSQRLRGFHDAEDVTAEIVNNLIVKIREQRIKYDPQKASLATFLALDVNRRVIDHLRRQKRNKETPMGDEDVAVVDRPRSPFSRESVAKLANEAQLSLRTRVALRLLAANYTRKEVCTFLKIERRALNKLLGQGVQRLRALAA